MQMLFNIDRTFTERAAKEYIFMSNSSDTY